MAFIKVTGGSDDIIVVDGVIHEEFYPGNPENAYLAVSDGTLLKIVYDSDGIWRVTKVFPGSCEMNKVEGDVESDTFDVVTLTGDIRWVALASEIARP